ncbi:hypothetical protein ACTMTI_28300 [Nonomuraea sp. H19]|uniref:hypothetical protein n=1 Tax=Nonomuraea sp. H19 TaxID=3452206 RepID=UPI003F896E52
MLENAGYWWTEADEVKLGNAGTLFAGFEALLDGVGELAGGSAAQVWNDNAGEAVNAFRAAWEQDDAPHPVLSDATSGMLAVGAGLFISAALVLALKISVLVQLIALATAILAAIATAGATLGGSLLKIPVYKELTARLLNMLTTTAARPLLG